MIEDHYGTFEYSLFWRYTPLRSLARLAVHSATRRLCQRLSFSMWSTTAQVIHLRNSAAFHTADYADGALEKLLNLFSFSTV